MTAPGTGADDRSGRRRSRGYYPAPHYSVAPPQPEAPEGYAAPGMPGAPGAGHAPAAPARHRAAPARRRTGLAVAAAVAAMLLGAFALAAAPARTAGTVGWLVIAPAAAVAWPLGRFGGRSAVLPLLGAVLAAGSLFLAQLLGPELHPQDFPHGGGLDGWWLQRRRLDLAFYGIAAVGGFLLTRRTRPGQ
ncbi:hypothetical protein ACWGB8_14480 [Kitasatospora sp. NPDC054939]